MRFDEDLSWMVALPVTVRFLNFRFSFQKIFVFVNFPLANAHRGYYT